MSTLSIRRIGLFGGPLLGWLCYAVLPPSLRDHAPGPEQWADFTQASRATLGLMVWMAVC